MSGTLYVLRKTDIGALRRHLTPEAFNLLREDCRQYASRYPFPPDDLEDIVGGAISEVVEKILSHDISEREVDRALARAIDRLRARHQRYHRHFRSDMSEGSWSWFSPVYVGLASEIELNDRVGALAQTLRPLIYEGIRGLPARERNLLVQKHDLTNAIPLIGEDRTPPSGAALRKALVRAEQRLRDRVENALLLSQPRSMGASMPAVRGEIDEPLFSLPRLKDDVIEDALKLIREGSISLAFEAIRYHETVSSLSFVPDLPYSDLRDDSAFSQESDLAQRRILSHIVEECSRELMEWLARHPEDLYRIHPGTFERVVAEVFRDQGFVVDLVSSWNQPDGGVDLLAVKKVGAGLDIRLAIQCKRHQRRNHVTAEPLRSLHGVLDRFNAHTGVLATTSHFTPEAVDEATKHYWRIALRDYDYIVSALQSWGGYRMSDGGLWLRP